MGKSKAAKTQVPECRYGSACSRRDCIFRHPPKKEREAVSQQGKSDKVCFAFVAGRCAFGKYCHDRHPDLASCVSIKGRYAKIDCQWGRGCRTEGCLYLHPSDDPIGPSMPVETPKPQPAVFAGGPTIAANGEAQPPPARASSSRIEVVPVPEAVSQAISLRDLTVFSLRDPLERFLAINARNSGTRPASLMDLHFQSVLSFKMVLDEVLPERLKIYQRGGVWLITGGATPASSRTSAQGNSVELFCAVREYLLKHGYEFAIGQDENGLQIALHVYGRKPRSDPLEGVRVLLLCGPAGSGQTMLAEALVRKSNGRFVRIGREPHAEDAYRRAVQEACAIAQPLPPIVVLDRCNASPAERARWVGLGSVRPSQVLAVHFDTPLVVGRAAQSSEPYEPPSEQEGFRAIVRLRGSAAAVQELVRRWTQGTAEGGNVVAPSPPTLYRSDAQSEQVHEIEAPPPPLPQLSQWIEIEEIGGKRSVWGVPLGVPVDAPAPLDGAVGSGADRPHRNKASGPPPRYAPDALLAPQPGPDGIDWGSDEPLPAVDELFDPSMHERSRAWPGGSSAQVRPERHVFSTPLLPPSQDAEECARQEQLAATLRCMGFDDDSSNYAALHAGGNLNVAVESVLRGC